MRERAQASKAQLVVEQPSKTGARRGIVVDDDYRDVAEVGRRCGPRSLLKFRPV